MQCDEGWDGFNCSEPEKPCNGLRYLRDSYGSVTDGYGRGRNYATDINCTWIIQPDIIRTEYGLPLIITFTYFHTESTYDPVVLYINPYVTLQEQVQTFDGTYPRYSEFGGYGMPHLAVVLADNGVAVNFLSDPTTTKTGFRFMYGTLERNYIEALKHPLLSPNCTRQFENGSPECEDDECTNCGVTTTETEDEAVTAGQIDKMCFISQRAANQTHAEEPAGYRECSDVVYEYLQVPAGSEVVMRTSCPRGQEYTAIPSDGQVPAIVTRKACLCSPVRADSEGAFYAGRMLDKPEFILGPGPPQREVQVKEEGQAYQKGYTTIDWFKTCSPQCDVYRRDQRHDMLYRDLSGQAGPILGARLYARNSSRASRLHAELKLYPETRGSADLYGYPMGQPDPRSWEEKNSRYLLDAFGAKFERCTAEGGTCELFKEICILTFTPTIPGFYTAEFFNLRKFEQSGDDAQFMEAVPFPSPNHMREVIVVPGPTSAPHSKARGPGINYAKSGRAGAVSWFHIDSHDKLFNARLSGGDQWNVVFVHQVLQVPPDRTPQTCLTSIAERFVSLPAGGILRRRVESRQRHLYCVLQSND